MFNPITLAWMYWATCLAIYSGSYDWEAFAK